VAGAPALAAEEPDLILRRSTVFQVGQPNDKLATYGVDDPEVEGVACHFTVPERAASKGWLGTCRARSRISRWHAARSARSISKGKMEQGDDMFRKRRRCSSRKCRSFAAATPSATYWSIWSIPTS